MKSTKRIKELSEIVLPFLLSPRTVIEGGINGKMFHYYPGFKYEITPEIFECLWNGGFAYELENSAK